MVQQYHSPARIYKYPFDVVLRAYEKRFPTCHMIPVFLGSDILSTEDDSIIKVVKRKCYLAFEAPYLLKKMLGIDEVCFIQTNTLDRKMRTLNIEAHNESFSSRVFIREHCIYSVHPENENWTVFEQDASLDVKSFFGFESAVERMAMKQYTTNIKKGKEVIEHYVREVYKEDEMNLEETDVNKNTNEFVVGFTGGDLPVISIPTGSSYNLSLKLDADYIERYLGDLTPYEESCLVLFRCWLQETHKGKIPKDQYILRFLKARDFNIEKSYEMICHSLAWRKQTNIDKLLKSFHPSETLCKYFSGEWHHNDKDGRPLYILRLGQLDVKGLIKSVGHDALYKHILSISEKGIQLCDENTQKFGKPICNFTLLLDLEGMSMRHLWRPGIKGLLRIIEILENNYPESIVHVLIIRAPRIFPILWTLISPFINEKSREKFLIYGGMDYKSPGGLIEYLDEKILPDFLGGECLTTISEGGIVPKLCYLSLSEISVESEFNFDTMYHVAHIVKDIYHEVHINVPTKGSVITWDFDILKGDVIFSILKCRRALSSMPHEHRVFTGSAPACTQFTDKLWTPGVDYLNIEGPLVCRDGDSVQGSHVVENSGDYLMQWKLYENRGTFDKILSSHKSKVMYYVELLPAENFKGSMNSLHSSYSGFSHLSQNHRNLPTNSATLNIK